MPFRLQELHDSAAGLQRQYQEALAAAVRAGHEEADEEDRQDPEQLLHAARTARAELLIARRQRTALQKEVLATRSRLVAAETAVEISQLRINKVGARSTTLPRALSVSALLILMPLPVSVRRLVSVATTLRGL